MQNNKRLIAKIFNGEEVIMKIDRNMLSCEFGALDRGNLTDVVNWGIYANRGSISFVDNIGYFNNQNVNSEEIQSYNLVFYLVDKTKETIIATFNIEDVDLDEYTRRVDIRVVSPLLKLQYEKSKKRVYLFSESNVSGLISYMNNNIFPNSTFSIGEEDKNNVKIGCTYIPVDTVWNIITKICQATMSRVIETPNGNFQIASSFPKRTPIIVAPKNIIGVNQNDFVIIKNPNIDITIRKKYENEILDGSKLDFSISWDTKTADILGTNGITLSNIENVTEGDRTTSYSSGKITIKTPYKIFSLGEEETAYNIRYIYFSNSTDEYPSLDTKTTSLGILLDNPSVENEQNIIANLKRRAIYDTFPTVSGSNSGYKQFFFSDGTFSFPIITFEDTGTEHLHHHKGDGTGDEIESNDLIQDISYYENNDGDKVPLSFHIVEEVYKRYHNGIECFEIECLFNDYYDENGNKVFSKDDLSTHFKKYDLIIPYVNKKGKTVPLRLNEDGTPKKFRVIGISYSYDGLLKQKLSVQEERYDID